MSRDSKSSNLSKSGVSAPPFVLGVEGGTGVDTRVEVDDSEAVPLSTVRVLVVAVEAVDETDAVTSQLLRSKLKIVPTDIGHRASRHRSIVSP